MELKITIGAILLAGCVLTAVLFLVFAQVTVRKLEKDPKTKQALGFEYVGGWRTSNVAAALVLPMGLFRVISKTPLSLMYANAELLRQRTSRIDKVIAHLFYWPYTFTGFGLIVAVVLNLFGFFEWYESL